MVFADGSATALCASFSFPCSKPSPPITRSFCCPSHPSLFPPDLGPFTNLRINFTELPHIPRQGYHAPSTFYAVTEMQVLGSCFCHGHAEHCAPAGDQHSTVSSGCQGLGTTGMALPGAGNQWDGSARLLGTTGIGMPGAGHH